MIEQITAAIDPVLNLSRDIWKNISKKGKITIVPSISLVNKGHEKLYNIQGKIETDYLVIYKVKILSSGENQQYIELSIRENFVNNMIKEPFMNILNPIIKHGVNYFEMRMSSQLQPVQDMVNKTIYAVLLDAKGNYIRRGLIITEANINKDNYSYKQKMLRQEKGKIKNMELEIQQMGNI